jgi:hypothetical protein
MPKPTPRLRSGDARLRAFEQPTPSPPRATSRPSRPLTLRYRKLIADLARANELGEAGGDDLSVMLRCVVSMVHFLDADLVVLVTGHTRPLGALAAALRDLAQGARPALFFKRRKKGPGRPKDLSFEAARGAIAGAVAALINWGEKRPDAGRFVAARLKVLGLRLPNGDLIGAKQVLRWRDEIGAGASNLAEQTFKTVAAKYAVVPPEVASDGKRRRAVVVGALIAVRSEGF